MTPEVEPFAVEATQPNPSTTVLALRGELDLFTADQVTAALPPVPAGGRLVVDLRRLSFMDSTGIRVLMSLDLRSRAEDWELVVATIPGPVQRILDTCRISDRIRVVGDAPLDSRPFWA